MKTWISAAALVMALGACTGTQQKQVQDGAQSLASAAPAGAKDAYLTAAVGTKLAAIDVDSTTSVHIAVDNGTVTLTGQARSAQEQAQFVAAAQSVDGVATVNNRLTVDPHLRGVRETTDDAALTTKVTAAIAAQAGINVFHVVASARAGTVTITGTVPTRSVERTIVDTVRGVSDVRTVVDRLTVKSS